MSEDQQKMYLENLDEFINDENKVVTYKWLSKTLELHVNEAKRLLFVFVENQRNAKENDQLSVTYLVTGLIKSQGDNETLRVQIVREENLAAVKSSMSSVISCHVYSVQKSQLKNSNALYLVDYDMLKEDIYNSNKFSSIKYVSAKCRSLADLEAVLQSRQAARDVKAPTLANGKPPANKEVLVKESVQSKTVPNKGKVAPKSQIAGMFAASKKQTPKEDTGLSSASKVPEDSSTVKGGKTGSSTTAATTDSKAESKGEKSAKGKPQPGNVASMFAKQKERQTTTSTAVASKVETDKKAKQEEALPDKKPQEKKSPLKEIAKKQQNKKPAKRKKKTKKTTDEDEDPVPKRRRRIRDVVSESSSSGEEDMDELPESPIPESPPPKPFSPARSPSPLFDTPQPSKTVQKVEDSKETVSTGEKKRIRKRKLVPKTYVDEEGFMVTEKVYESESTDASEVEEVAPPKLPESVKVVADAKNTKEKASKKPAPKKDSPKGKGAGGKQQASLMSFFKKK